MSEALRSTDTAAGIEAVRTGFSRPLAQTRRHLRGEDIGYKLSSGCSTHSTHIQAELSASCRGSKLIVWSSSYRYFFKVTSSFWTSLWCLHHLGGDQSANHLKKIYLANASRRRRQMEDFVKKVFWMNHSSLSRWQSSTLAETRSGNLAPSKHCS